MGRGKNNSNNNGNIRVEKTPLVFQDIVNEYTKDPQFLLFLRQYNIDNLIEKHYQFSSEKTLYSFQQDALKNAVYSILIYYHLPTNFDIDKRNFIWINPSTKEKYSQICKKTLFEKYQGIIGLNVEYQKILGKDYDTKISRTLYEEAFQYFPYIKDDKLPLSELVNRSGLWMATGSGKTLVIVSLINILFELMEMGLIPRKRIMFLTAREDLVKHFTEHVRENRKLHIKDLKRFSKNEFEFNNIVYTYRYDLLNNEEKDTRIDFRKYENNGNWYVFLDEAHKGKEDSIRKLYIDVFARNGFIFNFSATFTEPLELITTSYNFNLSSFIEEGYGKNIVIVNKKMDNEDKEAILRSLIILAAQREMARKKVIDNKTLKDLYHMPIGVFLVNSVSGKSDGSLSDLEQVLRVIVDIASGKISEHLLRKVVGEIHRQIYVKEDTLIVDELSSKWYDHEKMKKHLIEQAIPNPDDILKIKEFLYRNIFNTDAPTSISFALSQSKDEILLLNESGQSFLLIRVGDVNGVKSFLTSQTITIGSGKNKKVLKGLGLQEMKTINANVFDNLEKGYDNISILIGSRKFYEGWDNVRPNVLCFVNLGKDNKNTKFVLQAIGRGVRIRYNGKYGQSGRQNIVNPMYFPIETLFVFSTLPKIMEQIIFGMKIVKERHYKEKITNVKKNEERIRKTNLPLVVPKVEEGIKDIQVDYFNETFEVSEYTYNLIKNISDNLLFSILSEELKDVKLSAIPKIFKLIREKVVVNRSKNKRFEDFEDIVKQIKRFTRKILNFSLNEQYAKHIHLIDADKEELIIHYKDIEVIAEDEETAKKAVEKVKKILDLMKRKNISEKHISDFSLTIRQIQEHFYTPVFTVDGNSQKLKVRFKNAINVESETKFVEDIFANADLLTSEFGNRWMFSKIVERIDGIYIPYEDKEERLRYFYPDFILWTSKEDKMVVVFIDPKGSVIDQEDKIRGLYRIFGNPNNPKIFECRSKKNLACGKIRKIVFTGFYYNDKGDKDYFLSDIGELIKEINKIYKNIP